MQKQSEGHRSKADNETAEVTDAKIKVLIAKPENRIEPYNLVDQQTEKLLVAIQALQTRHKGVY
jgi:hypothetical protein